MFSGIETEVKSWASDEARDAFAHHLVEMDIKWVSLTKTTASVISVVVASAKDRVLAKELCDGVMDLLGRMCDAWANAAGDMSVPLPDADEVFEESKAVDRLGQRLGSNVDDFLGVIMTQVFVPILGHWSEMFIMLSKTGHDLCKVLPPVEVRVVSSGCADELRKSFRESREWLATILVEGSSQSVASKEWVGKARPRFEQVAKAWGEGSDPHAMAAVVREMGFPDAMR